MKTEDLQEGKVLLVDKPLDWTSFQVVNKIKFAIKKKIGIKKIKVGHAGTLDPKATGLLVVCVGRATKTISQIQDKKKEYFAKIKLGVQTESYDTEKPEINPQSIVHLQENQVREKILNFVGEITQTPPVFSAVKIGGERAYEKARKGEEITLKSRKITIEGIREIEIDFPFVSFVVVCSKGTYIRSLAHDIGLEIGVGAYLVELRRTKIGEYSLQDALSVEEIIHFDEKK